jgi:hypothetical protein
LPTSPSPFVSRVLAFLSTGFVLWLLSAVGLGLFGYGWKTYQDHKTSERQRHHVKTEIVGRLDDIVWG